MHVSRHRANLMRHRLPKEPAASQRPRGQPRPRGTRHRRSSTDGRQFTRTREPRASSMTRTPRGHPGVRTRSSTRRREQQPCSPTSDTRPDIEPTRAHSTHRTTTVADQASHTTRSHVPCLPTLAQSTVTHTPKRNLRPTDILQHPASLTACLRGQGDSPRDLTHTPEGEQTRTPDRSL